MLSTDRNPNGIIANSFLECGVEMELKEHLDSGKTCCTPLMTAEIHRIWHGGTYSGLCPFWGIFLTTFQEHHLL